MEGVFQLWLELSGLGDPLVNHKQKEMRNEISSFT